MGEDCVQMWKMKTSGNTSENEGRFVECPLTTYVRILVRFIPPCVSFKGELMEGKGHIVFIFGFFTMSSIVVHIYQALKEKEKNWLNDGIHPSVP